MIIGRLPYVQLGGELKLVLNLLHNFFSYLKVFSLLIPL